MTHSKALMTDGGQTWFSQGSGFWFIRIGQGVALGVIIATLDFLYYAPLLPVPIDVEFGFFISSLVLWSGECTLFALIVAAAERIVSPRYLHAWQLAAIAFAAVTISVFAWHGFSIVVLRDLLGVNLFREQVAASGNWVGHMLYHSWLMLFFGGLCVAVAASHRWHFRMLMALRAAEMRHAISQQSLATAELARLESSVDPNYLFQTLARLEKLYADNPQAADAVLDDLINFLRRVLGESRAFLEKLS